MGSKILFMLAVSFMYGSIRCIDRGGSMVYLQRYGYLTSNLIESTMSDDMLSVALQKFQKMVGIPMTGQLDRDTDLKMANPRCGVMDNFDFVDPGWNKTLITYRVLQYSEKFRRDTIDRQLAKSFAAWSRYTPLIFSRRGFGDVDIKIYFTKTGPANEFNGTDGRYAFALFPSAGGSIYFNDAENWSEDPRRGRSFFHVAIHEIGHALGLEHSDQRCVMFPLYATFYKDLLDHDVDQVQVLYGGRYPNKISNHAKKSN